MSGFLGRRRGPDDLFPNEKREDEGGDQKVLGLFFRVSLCYLDDGSLI